MKSVAFLRNTWKKWEQKASDSRDNTEIIGPPVPQKPSYPQSSAAAGRCLTVTVKHLPLEISTPTPIEGSWQRPEGYQPPPVYDQFTQRDERTLVHRDSSRFALDATYRAHVNGAPMSSKADISKAQKFPKYPSAQTPNPSNRTPWPVICDDKETHVASSSRRTLPLQTPPSSPRFPSLPSYQPLPPIDLNYGPGSKFDASLEANTCKCARSGTQTRHHSRCPRYTFLEAHKSMAATTVSDSHRSQKTVHAVLDLSVDSKPLSLYHKTGSTPHLPYKDRNPRSAPSEISTYSADSSEADHFPLSLFPAPPPLIVRKRVPAPLVLRTALPGSTQSSRDSTPVGTPTTPRFLPINSPAQSSINSPNKKNFSLRPSASFSPPPFSPPNSPLPSLPTSLEGSRRSSEHRRSPDNSARRLRTAQSHANLRDALPFPATHRLTSSEPISDQSSLPIRRSALALKPRPEAVRANDIQAYMELKGQAMSTGSSDGHVQWGYAL